METTAALPAHPVVLRDVEDLHDADLDDVVADGLAESYGDLWTEAVEVITAAVALARLVGQSRPGALDAHRLGR